MSRANLATPPRETLRDAKTYRGQLLLERSIIIATHASHADDRWRSRGTRMDEAAAVVVIHF